MAVASKTRPYVGQARGHAASRTEKAYALKLDRKQAKKLVKKLREGVDSWREVEIVLHNPTGRKTAQIMVFGVAKKSGTSIRS